MSEKPASARAATIALGALLLLATASLVFSLAGPQRFQMTASLLIASLKASLIAAVFMGLAGARASMRLALLLALVLTLVLLAFVGGDVWTRPAAAHAHVPRMLRHDSCFVRPGDGPRRPSALREQVQIPTHAHGSARWGRA